MEAVWSSRKSLTRSWEASPQETTVYQSGGIFLPVSYVRMDTSSHLSALQLPLYVGLKVGVDNNELQGAY